MNRVVIQAENNGLAKLVTDVATSLMTVRASSLNETCELVLQQLVAYFNVDMTFVRQHDHDLGATVLLAEWPTRSEVPDPDPRGVVFFDGADPIFAALESLSEVLIARPGDVDPGYQDRVRDGSGVMGGVSTVTIPMMRRGLTTGSLGLIQFGDRGWSPAEINSLTALAALLDQALSRVEAESRLRYLAYHDELTELHNRRALFDHLDDRLTSTRPGPVAIMLIDLDRLKAVNDFLGHAAGDSFLQSIAVRLAELCGTGDFAARLGGDEFVVVLRRPTDQAGLLEAAQRLQAVLTVATKVGSDDLSRTVSIGLAVGTPGLDSASELLNEADQAVNGAKARGGNGIVAFTEQMRIADAVRTDVELHLRDAIANDELVLHYQPQVDLVTGKIVGAEALVRWNHPSRGLLPPDSFIGVAEATNLAGELGRWVLTTACAQLGAWRREFDLPDFRLGVNVSPAQIISIDLVDDIAAALESNAIAATNLTVEITETAVVADPRAARETLDALTTLGVHLAIDDFGTGYSSFAQLKTLPVHTLKIDRSFVANVATNPDDQAIVRSVVSLAASFGLTTLAEGVQTTQAVATLIGLGCHQAQGYLIAKPLPAEQLRELLLRGYIPPSDFAEWDSTEPISV